MTKLFALAAALSFSAAFAAQAQPIMAPPARGEAVRVAAAPGPVEEEPAPAVDPAPVAPVGKPAGYRSASYKGGEGATWKTGRNSHGFSGTYGGCRYFGNAGPGGFSIDRVCR